MKNGTVCCIFHKALRYGLYSILFVIITLLILYYPYKIVHAQEKLPNETFLYSQAAYIAIFCLTLITLCILVIIFILRLKHISEKKVKEASLELRHITNSIHAGFVNFSLEHNYEIIYASNGYYDIVGYSKEEIQQEFKNSVITLVYQDDMDKFKTLRDGFNNGEYIQKEVRMITRNGSNIWILINGNYIEDKNGNHTLSAVMIDITDSKLMQERLLLEEERYRVAAEISNDILFEYEIGEDLMTFADKYKELYGRVPVIPYFSNPKTHAEKMIHPEDTGVFSEYCRALRSGKEMIESEFRIRDIKNDYVWCHTRGKTIYDDNKHATRVIGKIVNIDLHKKELQTLEFKAKRDPLTGVYNKSTTKDLIDHFIQKHSEDKHIFMIVDIDDFKSINDRYGHLQGDKILSFVINQVKMIFTAGEIIGRIGGDEFAIFIGDISNKETAFIKADLLQRALRSVYREEEYEISVSGSIGVSIYPRDGKNYNQLLNCADKALYDVKDQGKDGFKLFT
ncbi:MAG: diguanylate cyclase [Anaerocolumna sp.]